uniref:RING-type domain-containing protein n=1 Tax=Hucho hucho TaxID=62062 RepID=A0A4W5MGD8_9TELE
MLYDFSFGLCLDMASSSSLLSEEQFLCSICLDVFTDPVAIPCGHNFCKACIRKYWDTTDLCQCPMCKEEFYSRPDIRINTLISEMAAQFRKSSESYQQMCKEHDKFLEMFCRTDQTCVCVLCIKTDHKTHYTVPLKEEYGKKKAQLGKTEVEVQQMIQKQLQKVKDIKHSIALSKRDAEREIAGSVQVFTALVHSIERSQAEFIEVVEEKQKAAERRAEGLIKELEQEFTELQRRSTELEQLSHTEDHLHLPQSPPHPSAAFLPPRTGLRSVFPGF